MQPVEKFAKQVPILHFFLENLQEAASHFDCLQIWKLGFVHLLNIWRGVAIDIQPE